MLERAGQNFESLFLDAPKATCSPPFITVSRTFWNISVSRHVLNEFWSDFCRLSAFSKHVSKEVFEDRWRPERFVIMFRNVKTRRTYHLHFYQATITFISSAITEGSAHTTPLEAGLSLDWAKLYCVCTLPESWREKIPKWIQKILIEHDSNLPNRLELPQ